jgi:hypothetical protein
MYSRDQIEQKFGMTESKLYRTGLLVLMALEQTNGNNPRGRWWWWVKGKNNDDDDNLFVYVYCTEGGKTYVCLDVPQKHRDLFAVAFTYLSFMIESTLKYANFNILGHWILIFGLLTHKTNHKINSASLLFGKWTAPRKLLQWHIMAIKVCS